MIRCDRDCNADTSWCPDFQDDGVMQFYIRKIEQVIKLMYADKTVSCVGICQAPMLSIETEMETLNEGQVLQVTTDKPDLVEMVRSWAGESGHTIEEEHVTSGVTTIIMRKGRVAPVEAK